jgi:hypothetical protein
MFHQLRVFLLSSAIGVLASPLASAQVVIHEIMYHPNSLLEGDEFLELRNLDPNAVDLGDWSVEGLGFSFPPGATIAPHGFLVLARDAATFQSRYGTAPDFVYSAALSNSGETLALRDGSGQLMDHVTYTDESPWPVTPDGLGPSLELVDPALPHDTPRNWRACTATAGHTVRAANSVAATGPLPWIANVQFPREPQPQAALAVTAQVQDANSVQLTYVVNFDPEVTVPMIAAGDDAYGAVIPGQSAETLIRFRIVATGDGGSMQYPRTDDTIRYDGTKVASVTWTTALLALHWYMDPNDYAQLLAHYNTDELEPAVLYFNGTLYDNIQMRARGQTSRSWPKKNWKIHMPHGHDLRDPAHLALPLDQFDLQSDYSDKSYLREILAHETLRDTGGSHCQAFHVRLQQNGQFYGLYTFRMAMDDDYLEYNGLGADNAWYKAYNDCHAVSLSSIAWYYQKHAREWDNNTDIYELLLNINGADPVARRAYLFDNIDLPAMLNYLAGMVLIHNNDQVAKNYFLYRDTEGTQRWFMQPWDLDLTFGRNYGAGGPVLSDGIWADNDDVGRVNVSPSHPLFGNSQHQKFDYLWNYLIDALYADPDIRAMFFRRLRTVMDQLLAPGYYENRIAQLRDPIAPEAELDRTKWGQYGQAQTPTAAVDIILNDYLPRRRTHLFVTHRVPGEIPAAQLPTPPIVISEIMYNPASGADRAYVELYNPSTTDAVDLTDWTLSGADFVFRPGTVLLPQQYGVIAKNDVVLRTAYGGGFYICGQFPGNLNPSGATLELRSPSGALITVVSYDDDPPWPTSPDGGGPSLELRDPTHDNGRPANWAASLAPTGTPGAPNSVAGALAELPAVWINEVLPLNTGANRDEAGEAEPWVELYNTSSNPCALGSLWLSDDYAIPHQWAFPPTAVLDANSRIIVWADAEPADGPLHTSFRLSATGGHVGLYDADGRLLDYLNYPALEPNCAFGKYPDGTPAALPLDRPTPGATNVHTAATPLILNEYNAVDADRSLRDNGTDTYWGRVAGNGGDWFELVVTTDHLDARGWHLVISDDTGGSGHTVETLTLSQHTLWSDLRIGAIITIAQDAPDEVSFDPNQGDWWINVQAVDGGADTYITPESFKVSNKNWQLTITDAGGQVVFGPAGEGVAPPSGIGGDEVCLLAENPSGLIRPTARYDDGIHSTFGAPNIFDDGVTTQDFSALRARAAICQQDSDCDDSNPCTEDTCAGLAGCVHTPRADGAPCTDGLFCNGTESCWAGACQSGTPPCADLEHCDEDLDVCRPCAGAAECDDGNPCTVDACDTGNCTHTACADGTACDDGLYCTTVDACQSGVCVGTGSPCGDGCARCDELARACVHCAFDLHDDGLHIIGGADFAIFAGYYGSCYAPGDPGRIADFDGDGCVTGADFSLFAGCYAGACDTCAGCFPADE